jgi:hypothetical protein
MFGIIMDGHTPLFVVVLDHEWVGGGPEATGDLRHGLLQR